MIRNEVVDTVSKLSKEMRVQWLIALGSHLRYVRVLTIHLGRKKEILPV